MNTTATTATTATVTTAYRQAADALQAETPQYRSSGLWSRLVEADHAVRFRGVHDAPDIRTACRRAWSHGDMVENGLF